MDASDVTFGALLFLTTLIASLAVAVLVLLRLPAGYFVDGDDDGFWSSRPAWQKTAARVGKNVLGAFLVVVGVFLSLPGIPGQGLLTILIGITLLDIPGKRRVERRLARIPAVLRALNRLRERFGKPRFESPAGPSRAS